MNFKLNSNQMNKIHIWASLLVLLLACGMLIFDFPILSMFRGTAYDTFHRWHPRPYQPAPVGIIDIDEQSLARHGQWPWPRSLLAKLISRLTKAGSSAIVFDMVFSEPDRTSPANMAKYFKNITGSNKWVQHLPDHDAKMADAIKNSLVVTGFSCSSSPTPFDLPQNKARFIIAGDDPKPWLHPFKGAVSNLAILENAATGNGSFNFIADHDGLIRHIPLLVQIKKQLFPTLAAEALRVAQGEKNIVIKSSGASGENQFNGSTGIVNIRIGALEVPTDSRGEVWLHYSKYLSHRYIPAWKVLSEEFESDILTNRIMFIGTSAKGLQDLRFSPLGGTIPGVEVHAQLAEQIIQHSYLIHPDWGKLLVLVLLVIMWGMAVILSSRINAAWLTIAAIVFTGMICFSSWVAFTKVNLFIDPLFPAFATGTMFITNGFFRLILAEKEKRWIQKAFSSYISPNLVNYLMENPNQLELGGEKRECSFVLTDLAGFTTLMESIEPAKVALVLNTYIDEIMEIAFQYDATLDRIVGDAVALMFSAPVKQPDHAQRAVACAMAMDKFCQDFARIQNSKGISFGITRIGVHTGTVLVGNFGGKSMFDYRALGDPINTCARLETVNKHLGTRICVSSDAVDRCPGFVGRPVGTLVLKGKTKGIKTFEPLNQEEWESSRVEAYLKAFNAMADKNGDELSLFQAFIKKFPEDSLGSFHIKRLKAGEKGALVVMSEK
jgi:adenylate cyclase